MKAIINGSEVEGTPEEIAKLLGIIETSKPPVITIPVYPSINPYPQPYKITYTKPEVVTYNWPNHD